MAAIKINDQVIFRQPNPRIRVNTLLFGQVVAIDAAKAEATVHFTRSRQKKNIRMDQLEPVKSRFSGRARVGIDTLQRRIS